MPETQLLENPMICEKSRAFYSQGIITIPSSKRVLYVHQGEIAYDISGNDFDFIGSDDATTCHVLIARCFVPKIMENFFLVVHLDSPERADDTLQYLDFMGAKYSDAEFDIYVCGGLAFDSCSEAVTRSIIRLLKATTATCSIQLFSTCQLNSEFRDIHRQRLAFPRTFGSAWSKEDNCVVPAFFPEDVRGPAYLTRCALLYVDESPKCRPVYTGDGNFKISMRPFQSLNSNLLNYFKWVLSIREDSLLLQRSSTSPHCEPSHFVHHVRQLSRYIVENYDMLLLVAFDSVEARDILIVPFTLSAVQRTSEEHADTHTGSSVGEDRALT
jgi:hypothetical protein